jgi:hypothetical protein
MKRIFTTLLLVISSMACLQAQIRITEVTPWGSTSTFAADWFELTNTGASAVDITGWKVDDNSNSFASSLTLNGITSIAAGESVIFIESDNDAIYNTFKTRWFGASVPAGLQIGRYNGSGIGLGGSGDAVNIYNASGTLMANVVFGASTTGGSGASAEELDAFGTHPQTASLLPLITFPLVKLEASFDKNG